MPLWTSYLCPCFISGQPPGKSPYPRCFQGKNAPASTQQQPLIPQNCRPALPPAAASFCRPAKNTATICLILINRPCKSDPYPVCNLAIPSPAWQPPAHFPKPHMQGTKPEHLARTPGQSAQPTTSVSAPPQTTAQPLQAQQPQNCLRCYFPFPAR